MVDNARKRVRDWGITIGDLQPGMLNSITDVTGVKVGQITVFRENDIRTGVTVVLPHGDNVFQEKVPAAIAVGNGFGKLIGHTQVRELGYLESPVALTNTLSAPIAAHALNQYTIAQSGNEEVRSFNPVVGETNDGRLNNIRAHAIVPDHVLEALAEAKNDPVKEGATGAGTGTVCLGYKGGIGSASRKMTLGTKTYVLGVLVQTNFSGSLEISGVPVGKKLAERQATSPVPDDGKGSCMIVVATDAPLSARQLGRLGRRSFSGMVRTGGNMTHGSGDYAVAFSTAQEVRTFNEPDGYLRKHQFLYDQYLNPFFQAAIEATEEAILNSLFMATAITGINDITVSALPAAEVINILSGYRYIFNTERIAACSSK